ncbi:MAG TPA: VOC family protein [Bryobacteraceae bacterium]|jgi:methylmalonyl-CoA/ethylmalonyl-CoA epimerase|nr:VOC family protein [Bryobacteraceae bacterium]
MTIAQIGLAVRNLDEAVEFYRDKLGLNLRTRSKSMALFDCGECRLALERCEAEHPENSSVYFHVDDLDAAIERLRGRGVRFDRGAHLVAHFPDHDLWLALFRDAEGNRLGLMCWKRQPALPEPSRLQ